MVTWIHEVKCWASGEEIDVALIEAAVLAFARYGFRQGVPGRRC